MRVEVRKEHIGLETGAVCACQQQRHPICRAIEEAVDYPDTLGRVVVGPDRLFCHHQGAVLKIVRFAPEVVDWVAHESQWHTGEAHRAPRPITLELDWEELLLAER